MSKRSTKSLNSFLRDSNFGKPRVALTNSHGEAIGLRIKLSWRNKEMKAESWPLPSISKGNPGMKFLKFELISKDSNLILPGAAWESLLINQTSFKLRRASRPILSKTLHWPCVASAAPGGGWNRYMHWSLSMSTLLWPQPWAGLHSRPRLPKLVGTSGIWGCLLLCRGGSPLVVG